MFQGQLLHLVCLAGLLAGAVAVARTLPLSGEFLGLLARDWLRIAVLVPIAHQIWVWLVWRLELRGTGLRRRLGHPAGFRVYAVVFFVLFVSRLLTIVALAIADRGTWSVPAWVGLTLGGLALAPALALFHSVLRYFGLERALGIDHFDPAYRDVPFVRQGVFRLTSNGMYTFGFLGLWVPGLLLRSEGALLAALFNHLYIWVHYLGTERPDMRRIYGDR